MSTQTHTHSLPHGPKARLRDMHAPLLRGVVWGGIQAASPLGIWWLDPAAARAHQPAPKGRRIKCDPSHTQWFLEGNWDPQGTIKMQPNQGEEMTTSSARRDIATNAYFDTFDAGDVDAVDTYFSSDLIDHNPTPGAPSAIDGMRGLVAAVRDGFTGTKHTIVYQAETDDGAIVTQWIMTGKHTGSWFGTPASGRDVSFAGTDIVRVVDGRINEIWHVEQLLQLQAQIAGLIS